MAAAPAAKVAAPQVAAPQGFPRPSFSASPLVASQPLALALPPLESAALALPLLEAAEMALRPPLPVQPGPWPVAQMWVDTLVAQPPVEGGLAPGPLDGGFAPLFSLGEEVDSQQAAPHAKAPA